MFVVFIWLYCVFVYLLHQLLRALRRRGWRNTVGNLIEIVWLEKAVHGPQLTGGMCVKNRRVRLHRIQGFKQYCFNSIPPTSQRRSSPSKRGEMLQQSSLRSACWSWGALAGQRCAACPSGRPTLILCYLCVYVMCKLLCCSYFAVVFLWPADPSLLLVGLLLRYVYIVFPNLLFGVSLCMCIYLYIHTHIIHV